MNRRDLLGAVTAVAASATCDGALAQAPTPTTTSAADRISWEEFLALAQTAAEEHFANRSQSGQDAYLHAIARHAVRLGELPATEPTDFGGLSPAYQLDLIHRGSPFIVLFWRMEPGALFPAHCHPVANVCTLCTGGQGAIRNFEPAAGSPSCSSGSDHEFELIETRRELLRPGVINEVTEFRNNLHMFEAGPEGVEGIDITTVYERSPPFSFARLIEEVAAGTATRRHRARWVGRDPRRAVES